MLRRAVTVVGALGVLVVLSACGGSPAPPSSTTTTTSPAAGQAGKEVCQGFYAELLAPQPATTPIDVGSWVERAKQAGPRLAQIFEGIAQLSVDKRAGTTPEAELEDRTKSLLASLQIVCQDDYGVPPPNIPVTAPGG